MEPDDESEEILEDVNRIHPAVDRLRKLLESAAILDLKANSQSYWASHEPSDRRQGPSGGDPTG